MRGNVRATELPCRELLDALPAAIYTTDAAGRLTYYNAAAVQLAGRTPEIGSDEWCVTWRLYWPDGTPLPHNECPMAIALKTGRPVRGTEAIAGTSRWHASAVHACFRRRCMMPLAMSSAPSTCWLI